MFGYSLNYLIDLTNAIIVDVEATPTRISKEVDATETMLERTVERFALEPDYLAADVAYGTRRDARLVGRARHRSAHPRLGSERSVGERQVLPRRFRV